MYIYIKQAYDSMLKERESEAKLARAREAREKADKERYENTDVINNTLFYIFYFQVRPSCKEARPG